MAFIDAQPHQCPLLNEEPAWAPLDAATLIA
jgi:hypothetical protein